MCKVHNMSVTVILLVTFMMKEILSAIDAPILTEFEPSDWVVKNFGSYVAIKRNNNNTDVIGYVIVQAKLIVTFLYNGRVAKMYFIGEYTICVSFFFFK